MAEIMPYVSWLITPETWFYWVSIGLITLSFIGMLFEGAWKNILPISGALMLLIPALNFLVGGEILQDSPMERYFLNMAALTPVAGFIGLGGVVFWGLKKLFRPAKA